MVRHPKTLGAQATMSDAIALFDDDHVHMALVIADDDRLITTIERADIAPDAAGSTPLSTLGTLDERTVGPECLLRDAVSSMRETGRRRLAVVGPGGRLLGLLCLKRRGDGFCSDAGISARAAQRRGLGAF